MAKRLICMLLATLMLLVVFTSCAGTGDAIDNAVDEASRYTSTLNLWVMADEDMDPEQAKAVNDAINKLTKKKFRTQLNIKYIAESEYYEAVEKAFVDYKAAMAEAKKNGTTLTSTSTSEETILNEYGVPELKYPASHDAQVDILFIGDAEKYRTYAENEWIAPVDGLLEDTGVQLSYYVNKALLTSAKYKSQLWAIPNNSTIGNYTLLAVDEKLANEYLYTAEDFKGSAGGVDIFGTDSMDFLSKIYTRLLAGTDAEGIHPIYSDNGKVELDLLHYWNFDVDSVNGACLQLPSAYSIFGSFYYGNSYQGATLSTENLLLNELYSEMLADQVYVETAGKDTPEAEDDFVTTDPSKKSAFRIVHGGYDEIAKLEEAGYTVLVAQAPRVTDESVFDSMFAIGNDSAAQVRAMEIITYINTNPDIRNLLQYGIVDENYTLESVEIDGAEYFWAKETETNGYKMDLRKTGNVFVAYPDAAEKVLDWEYGKAQNLQAVTYPTLGLYLNLVDYKLDFSSIRIMNAVSAKFKTNVLDQFASRADVEGFFNGDNDPTNKDCPKDFGTADAAGFAQFLLDKIGEPVTYVENGATVTVDAAALAKAINCMSNTTLLNGKDALQSPGALYLDWISSSGIKD